MSDERSQYLYDIKRIQGGVVYKANLSASGEAPHQTSDMKTLASLLSLAVLAQSALAHCMLNSILFMKFLLNRCPLSSHTPIYLA